MTNIILDTNIILRQPKVLGLQIPDIHFLVPLDVIEELNVRATQRGASFDRRIDLIEKASHQGTVSIVNPDASAYRQFREVISSNKLSGADIAIVAIALSLINKGQNVKIATQDKKVWKFAKEHGIDILSETDVTNLLTNFIEPKTDATDTVQKEIVTYEKKEKRNFFTGILTGAIITFFAPPPARASALVSPRPCAGAPATVRILSCGILYFTPPPRKVSRLCYTIPPARASVCARAPSAGAAHRLRFVWVLDCAHGNKFFSKYSVFSKGAAYSPV